MVNIATENKVGTKNILFNLPILVYRQIAEKTPKDNKFEKSIETESKKDTFP